MNTIKRRFVRIILEKYLFLAKSFLLKAIYFFRPHFLETQIVICGIPRSGTSLLFNIISGITIDINPYTNENLISNEVSYRKLLHRKGSYISKMPSDIFEIKSITKVNARKKKILVFVCVRDPRDVMVSKHQLIKDRYYMQLDTRWSPTKKVKIKNGINQFYDAVLELKDSKTKSINFQIIRYEDLTQGSNVIDKFLAENGVITTMKADEYSRSDRLPYRSGDGITSGEECSGILKRKRNWSSSEEDMTHVLNLFAQNGHLHDYLKEFDYEENQEWIVTCTK